LQINIKQTMPEWKIRADVRRAFYLKPDTIVFNEAVAATHDEMRRQAKALGYDLFIPHGAAGQVCLAWRMDVFDSGWERVVEAMGGRKHVSPNRYVVRVRLVRKDNGESVALVGTHMVSSGWTGSHWLDAWRRSGWYKHVRVMRKVLAHVAAHSDVVIWSGDCNRPPYTWHGKAWGGLLAQFRRFATDIVVKTDHTHGNVTFDYVGTLSRKIRVRVTDWATPGFYSDHDGECVDLAW
jgi:hypothetical protein